MITKARWEPYPRPFYGTHATSRLTLQGVKFTYSRRSGRRPWVISAPLSSCSSTMGWDTLDRGIVLKASATTMRLLFLSRRPWKLTQRQWVKALWSAVFFSFKWKCQNKHCRTSTNWQRLRREANSPQPLSVNPTFTRQRRSRNWTIWVMLFCTSSKSLELMMIIIWLAQLCTRSQR